MKQILYFAKMRLAVRNADSDYLVLLTIWFTIYARNNWKGNKYIF